MKKISVGVLAHVDSGKTTLSEAMMFRSGNINKLGRVDHGSSFLDTFRLERDRGITIFSKQAVMKYGGCEFTLLDTPGHVDFSAETERVLQVLDYAVLVISGTDGVQSHTLTLWKLLRRYGVPCFIFVNKMDLDGADRELLLRELRGRLSEGCVDFSARGEEFFESLALCDEAILEKYYDGDSVADGDIARAVRERRIFPCLFGSALRLEGIDELLDCLLTYTLMPDYPERFAAKVFKLSEDKQKNRLTFLKITGGSLRVREQLQGARNASGEKINQIRIYSGEKFTAVDEAEAGTVCAVTGITFARPGDGLGAEENTALPVLEPVLTYSVILPKGIDAHTALEKLRLLENEDPTLNVTVSERNGELQVRLMGEIQLEVLRAVISDRFGFEVGFGEGSIIYKETIENTVEGIGHFEPLRHYAEVHLLMKPAPRDSGLRFNSVCREDVLDKNWQRLILTHLYEKAHPGVLTGAPITDMEITLASGRAHPKHTEGGDFRQATYRAVRQGLRTAKSLLLEPVYSFALELPSECVGRAMSDLQRMSGSFEPPEVFGESCVLSGSCPVSSMQGYAREVLKYTKGRGRLSCSLSGYQPCHNSEEVIAAAAYDPDADTDNPCDSVFCSHGAGYIVKWNEVPEKAHISSSLAPSSGGAAENARRVFSRLRGQKDIFAADKELMRIFEQTYGPVKKRGKRTAGRREAQRENQPSYSKPRRKQPEYDGVDYILVDGYNVIFSWDDLRRLAEESIDDARTALVNILCNYQGFRKCELIAVFDAYKVKGAVREVEKVNGITIVYTKEAETADMYIEKASLELSKRHRVRVVTSDGLEQLIILGNGALRVPSRAFYEEVREAEDEIRRAIEDSL